MPTAEEYGGLDRLRRTPGDLQRAIADKTDAELSRRPGTRSWAAKEIVCHLRDVEELFHARRASHPRVRCERERSGGLENRWRDPAPLDPEQWAEERQYLRNDTREALAAFERRRAEVLTLLQSLSPAEWRRGGIHLGRGRLTLGDWVARLAAHDDNHLDQLGRALQGRP